MPPLPKYLPWLAVAALLLINAFIFYKVYQVVKAPTVAATQAAASSNAQNTQPTTTPAVTKPAPKPVVIPTSFVPILMYHYIRDYTNANDPSGIDLSVSPTTFKTQLQAMIAAGYHSITLTDYAKKNYQGKVMVITFDDGYEDHFTDAFPVLQQLGLKGTFFIITDFVGRDGYMTRDQINQMAAAGMEMGAHTLDHKDLAVLSYTEAYRQISGSLPGMTPVFAYPSGEYSLETLSIVKALHITASVTTKENVATNLDSLQTLPRVRAKEHTDLVGVINGLIYQLKHPKPTS